MICRLSQFLIGESMSPLCKFYKFVALVALTVIVGGCQRDSHSMLSAEKENLLMDAPSKISEETVDIKSIDGRKHICLRVPSHLTHSLSVDGTFLTIEFNDIKDLKPQDHIPTSAVPGMGRYRLVITAYNDPESRDSALQRVSSEDTPVDIGDYGVALGRLSDPNLLGSILAVSRVNLLGIAFYITFDQGQQKTARKHETAAALSFVDSSLVRCQRK
jgi:hypothetical protein